MSGTGIKSSLFRKFGWIILILIILLLAGLAGIRFYWSGSRLSQKVVSLLKESLNRDLSIGSLDYSLTQGKLVAKDIRIINPPGMGETPLLSLPELEAEFDIFSIFSPQPVINQIKISQPVITLAQDSSGKWNYENLLKPSLGPRKNYLIESIEIKDATLRIKGETPLEFQDIQLRIKQITPGKPLSLQMESRWAQAKDATLKARGNLDWDKEIPTGQLNLDWEQLNLQSVTDCLQKDSTGIKLPYIIQGNLMLSLESRGDYVLKLQGTYEPEHLPLPGELSQGIYSGELRYDSHQDEIRILSAQMSDSTGLNIKVDGKATHLSGDPDIKLSLRPMQISSKLVMAWMDYHPSWLKKSGNIHLRQLDYTGKPLAGIHQVKSKFQLQGGWFASPDNLWKIDNLTSEISLDYQTPAAKGTPAVKVQASLKTGPLDYDRIPMDSFQGNLTFALKEDGSLQKFGLKEGNLQLAGTPIHLEGEGSSKEFQFHGDMKNLDVSRFPEAIRRKLNITQPLGNLSGTIKGDGPLDSHGPFHFTGELESRDLNFKVEGTSYPVGELGVRYSASLNPDKEILHFSELRFHSVKENWILNTQLDTFYGTPGWAKGDLMIPLTSLSQWRELYEKYFPETGLSKETLLGGNLSISGNYYFRKESKFEPELYQTHLYLNGKQVLWAEPDKTLQFASPELELNLSGDAQSFPSGSGSFTSSAVNYRYSDSTGEGELKGTFRADKYSAGSTLLTLNLENGAVKDSASSLAAEGIRGILDLSVTTSSSGRNTFQYQTDNLKVSQLVHPQFLLKELSLSAHGDEDKLILVQSHAQGYGGSLNLQGEMEMNRPLPLFSFKGGFENIQGKDLYSWTTTHYGEKYWPYPATGGTVSGKLEGFYETPTTSRMELSLNLDKLNMENEDITYLRKVSGDINLSLSSSRLEVTPFILDIEGKVKPRISGEVRDLFGSDSVYPFTGTLKLEEMPLSKIQDVFFEFLPSLLQDAELKGTAGITLEAHQNQKTPLSLRGGLTLKEMELGIKDELSIKGLNGTLPFERKNGLVEITYPERFRKEDYNQWLAAFRKIEKTQAPDLTADVMQSGFIQFQHPKIIWVGSKDGIEIPFLECELFGGKLYGRMNIHADGGWDAILLLENVSLKQITDARESTRGMISGRFNGMFQLNSDGGAFSKLKGTAQLWAIKSKIEKNEFSKEFLKKAAGRDLPPLFIQRQYAVARLRLSLKDGYLVFNDLLIQGKAFGRVLTQIGINPSGNKVSLDKFMEWIQEASEGTSQIRTEVK